MRKKKFVGFCGITFHIFSKQTNGSIYIQNFEFNEEFEKKNPEIRTLIHRECN